MKTLSQFVNEEEAVATEPQVYVVKDDQGQILSVSDTEKAAKEQAKKWNSENKKNGATVSAEPAKDYIK